MKRELSIFMAIVPLFILVLSAALSIFVWDAGMFIPLIFGIIATAIIGLIIGFTWEQLQASLSNGVFRAMPAIFILLIIGIIVGTWILSGIIPALIYYGLAIINPSIFLPTVALTTGIVAITLGSSFTSIATIGLAFMAIGQGMGFDSAVIAGAIISGAFFGDKLSPLSDTTNVAPAMVDTDLFSHIRHMLWDTIPAFIITLIAFLVIGFTYQTNVAGTDEIKEIMVSIQNVFFINPLLLLVPVFTIFLMIKRYPAIPSLIIVGILGALVALIVQGSTFTEVINAMTSGYQAETGMDNIDSLISGGGITSMLNTVGLVTIATALGGILESTGVFKRLIGGLVNKAKSTGSIIFSTIISTLVIGFASGAQFLAIILPGRAFTDTYKMRGLDTKNLSRSVEAAGTVGINLVPWGVPAIFAAGILNVEPVSFIPFIFFSYLVIIINVIYGFTGVTISKKEYDITLPSNK